MNAVPHPASKPLPDRKSRRTIVAVAYLIVIGLAAGILAVDAADPHLLRLGPVTEGLVYVGLLPAVVLGYLGLKRNVRGIADLPDAQLDERQLTERNRSYRTAYKVLGLLLVAAAMYTLVALTSMRWTLPMPTSATQGHVIFWSVWFLAATLPSVIMAWREPDIPEESE